MAHKKGQGSSRNGRDTAGKRRGIKVFAGESVSNASSWFDQMVSPPYGGTSSACRIDANGGSGRKEKSECHKLPNV